MAVDKYYVNLTRNCIQEALTHLVKAQNYVRKSGDIHMIRGRLRVNISALQNRMKELEEKL